MKKTLAMLFVSFSLALPVRAFAYNPFISNQAAPRQDSAATGNSAASGSSAQLGQTEENETRATVNEGSQSPSAFETLLARAEPEVALKQFGYSLFRNQPSAFFSSKNVPVTPDYIAGPGDELIISVWGRIEGRWTAVVDRDGNISIPKIGLVSVAGLSFAELKEALNKEFSKSYSDFNLNVTFGSLHSIRVYVVGNARRPGAYTISSLSTLVNALFEAGGPDKNGSMREIQLKRNGKTVTTFDLYDLLLKGDKSKDSKLLSEDVVFIPPVGPMAAIAGQVKTPAIYELKAGDKLTDLVTMAGGFDNTAFRGSVAMRRIFEHRFLDFYSGNLSEVYSDKAKDLPLTDGDFVKVFPVLEQDTAVNVAGAVAYPGKFGINKGATSLKEVVNLAGGLLPYASEEAEITRVKLSTDGIHTERFLRDISYLHNNAAMPPFLLEPNDHIMIKPMSDWKLYKMVKVGGEVMHPGVYTVKKGEKLSSVFERAGGFTDKAYPRGIIFIRKSAKEQQQKNLEEIAQRLEKQLLVESSVKMQTALSADETTAGKAEMEAKEKFVANLRQLKAQGRVYIKLNSLKSLKGSDYDIELEEEDSITIPSKSSVVNVAGAVMAQGSYVYSGPSYGRYVDMAGGYADYSKPGKTFILKADGSARKARKGLFFSARVEPGDTVVVPERFDRIAWLREIRDFTQILMNVALTAGVVIKVF